VQEQRFDLHTVLEDNMRKRNLWTTVFAAILILVGLLALLDSLRVIGFWSALGKLWPLILIGLGIWLLLRRRHEFWDENVKVKDGRSHSKAFGDLKIDAEGKDPHGIDAEMGFGDLELNLTKSNFSDRENIVRLALGFGDMRIWIPAEPKVKITASSGVGDIDLLGKTIDGFGKSLEHVDEGYESAQRKLRIFAKVGFGDIKVSRI
jgi:predicted membrane protein